MIALMIAATADQSGAPFRPLGAPREDVARFFDVKNRIVFLGFLNPDLVDLGIIFDDLWIPFPFAHAPYYTFKNQYFYTFSYIYFF